MVVGVFYLVGIIQCFSDLRVVDIIVVHVGGEYTFIKKHRKTGLGDYVLSLVWTYVFIKWLLNDGWNEKC